MKKLFFILSLALIGSNPLFAQGFMVSLSPGMSLPVGDYADIDLNNTEALFADVGISGHLELTYWLMPVLSTSIIAGGYSNNLDNTSLANALGDNVVVTDESYTNFYGMFSLGLGLNSENVSISLSPAVGLGYKSGLNYEAAFDDLVSEKISTTIENDTGLMYGLFFSTKFFLTDGFGLGLNASYVTGNLQTIGQEERFTLDTSLGINEFEAEFAPTAFNAGINLTFRIQGDSSRRRHRPGAGFYFGK